MLRATLKDLWARKIRLFTTSAAVLLGVAFMSGTLVLTDTVGRTFDDLFADVNRGTDEVVRAEATIDGDFDDQRPRLDDSIVTLVRSVDGVAVARGDILKNGVQIVGRDGKALGNPDMGAPTFGGIWTDGQLNPFTLAEGSAPVHEDDAVIDRKSAKDGNLAVGDRTTILTPDPIEVTVVGIATFGTIDSAGGASFVGMTEAAAQRWFAEPGRFDSVGVVAAEGVSQDELRDRIAAVLPDGHEVITGAEATKENQDSVAQGLTFFKGILLSFAGIALFVGSFIIYNTFGIIVAQRTKELALLRAIGASRRQVLRSVLLEATVVGVLASALGLLAGIGVAGLLKALLDAVGLEVPAGGVVVTTSTILTAFVTGTSVAISSAWFPARKASKVPPLAAMRDVAYERTTASRARVVIGLLVLLAGVALLLSGLLGDGGNDLAKVGLGALLTFIGVTILGPVLATPITGLLGAPLPRLKGMTGTLARENATRNPKRTASTASALMIGVALVGFITVFASSASKSVNRIVDDRFAIDVIIGGSSLSPQLASDLEALPEAESVTEMRVADANVAGKSAFMLGFDEEAATVFDIGVVAGSVDDLDDTGVALNEDWAAEHDKAIGDTLDVEFVSGGVQPLEVRALYTDKVLAGSYFVSLDLFDRYAPDVPDAQIFLTARDGVSADQLLTAVEAAAEPYPTAEVDDIAGFKESQAAQFQQLVTLIYGLLGLAVFIALLGIANTLALSVHERTRELGLLRAVGMSRSQVRSTVRWESVLIALLGTTLGLAIGLFFGWAMARAMRSEGFTEFSLPYGQLLVLAVLAAIAGVVAAIWPARRAARLNVLAAIASE
ncbi:MAG TPA: FtsX-like permease family protein [Acidimicrobiales bacterium]|nr:FtsX-like permease family protein [Acidimicrobiales bacterium]